MDKLEEMPDWFKFPTKKEMEVITIPSNEYHQLQNTISTSRDKLYSETKEQDARTHNYLTKNPFF